MVLFFKKGLLAFFFSQANAQTLTDALRETMRNNPTLQSQQATQRATEESTIQARAGWRPIVSIAVSAGYTQATNSPTDYAAGVYEANAAQAALTLAQPLYTGGRVAHAVQAADARVLAGREGLRLTEAQVLQAAITAYMDVLRDQDILATRGADLATLTRQVAETTQRYRLGALLTRTDVAQAEAQRAQAAAAHEAAIAQLDASRAAYRQAVGQPPVHLTQPGMLPGLPGDLAAAMQDAAAFNPALTQSALLARAATEDVGSARAARLPSIGLQGSIGYIGGVAPFHERAYDREATALVTLTQPIYAGGLIASQIRQAEDRTEAARQTAALALRTIEQAVETAWSAMIAGRAATAANQVQVAAAADALRGTQLEYADGLRTTLDVLLADQALRAAQVSLAQSRHDTVVAEATVLATVGKLESKQSFFEKKDQKTFAP